MYRSLSAVLHGVQMEIMWVSFFDPNWCFWGAKYVPYWFLYCRGCIYKTLNSIVFLCWIKWFAPAFTGQLMFCHLSGKAEIATSNFAPPFFNLNLSWIFLSSQIDAHVGAVNDLAFAYPNKLLCVVTCGDDKLIKVWDRHAYQEGFWLDGQFYDSLTL